MSSIAQYSFLNDDDDFFDGDDTFCNMIFNNMSTLVPRYRKPEGNNLFVSLGHDSSLDSGNLFTNKFNRVKNQNTLSQHLTSAKTEGSYLKPSQTPLDGENFGIQSNLAEIGDREMSINPTHSTNTILEKGDNTYTPKVFDLEKPESKQQQILYDIQHPSSSEETPLQTSKDNGNFIQDANTTLVDDDLPPPAYEDSIASTASKALTGSALMAEDISDPLNAITSTVTASGALLGNAMSKANANTLSSTGTLGNQIAAQNERDDSTSRMNSSLIGGNLGSLLGPLGTLTGSILGATLGGSPQRQLNTTSGEVDPTSKLANIY